MERESGEDHARGGWYQTVPGRGSSAVFLSSVRGTFLSPARFVRCYSRFMDRKRKLETAGRIGTFFARHLLALGATVAAASALWTLTYFALLLWAIVSGAGLGSPASYPLGLLVVLVGSTALAVTLLLPSTAFAEVLVRRLRLPFLVEIPISVSVLALLCLAVASITSTIGSSWSLRGVTIGFGGLFLALLVPLGLYWGSARTPSLLFSLLRGLPAAGRRILAVD